MVNAGYTLAAEPVAQRVANAVDPQRQALLISGILLFLSLFLQRFGIPLGAKSLNVVGPIGMAVAFYGLLRGILVFDKTRLITFLAFVVLLLAGMVHQVTSPPGPGGGPVIDSLLQFLLLTSFATLSFAEPVDEARFFRLVTLFLGMIAVAGLLQFAAQFVGISIFAFSDFLPKSILFEAGYNLKIGAGLGLLYKSNGFFLVEPSVFSQVMAMALIIEILAFRRVRYLILFITGLLLSLSGTGWIVLASFVLATGVGMGKRGLVIAFGTLFAITLALGLGAFVAPEIAAAFAERFDETARPGTSGFIRFVTPFWVLSDFMERDPVAVFLGIGSGVSERLTLPYEYTVNTPVKVALEYGFPALIAYVLLFVLGRRTIVQRALVVPCVVLFFLGGGYQQFPPILFLVLLLICVARLRPSAEVSRTQ